jgi:hypothetical protein
MAATTIEQDDKALALRRQGSSFAAIARDLGFERASDATRAFNRALRTRPAKEQKEVRDEENRRLDVLVQGVKSREGLPADDVERKLRNIERLRTQLMAS